MFHSKPRNDNSLADARGTVTQADATAKPVVAAADDINAQQLKATGTDGPVVTMGPKVTGSGKAVVGRTTAAVDTGASKAARNTLNNGAGSASRLSGAASKKPPKLKIDLSKPGAIQKLVNANPTAEDLVNVLKDPRLFKIFKTSMQTTKAGSIQAANDITDLGNVIARFTVRTENGIVRAEKVVSDAVWALPTQYKEWFRAGQLDRGFFPDIDYSLIKHGLDQRASLKTVNPFAKGYEIQLSETLPAHLGSLVTGTKNGRARGYKITALLDVRMPLGTGVPRADLLATLNDLIPADVRKWVAVVIDEFQQSAIFTIFVRIANRCAQHSFLPTFTSRRAPRQVVPFLTNG